MSVAQIAPVTAAAPAQAVTAVGDVAPAGVAAMPVDGATATGPTASEPQTAAQPPNSVAQAIDVALAAAAGRQGSLAPLLADLAQAVTSPVLSGQIKSVIAQVLAFQTPTEAPVTTETIKVAIAQSGLFLEAHLADLAPSSAPPPDLKAALLVLQRALAAVPANSAPVRSTAPPPTQNAADASPGPPATAPALPAQARTAIAQPSSPQTPAPETPPGSPITGEIPKGAPAKADPFAEADPAAATPANPSPQEIRTAVPAGGLPPRSSAPSPPENAPDLPSTPGAASAASTALPAQMKAATAPVPAQQTSLYSPLAAQIAGAEITETAMAKAVPLADAELPTLAPPPEELPPEVKAAILVLQRAAAAAPGARPAIASRFAAPPPPLRQSAPSAQAAEPAALPDGDEATIAQHLAGETDQALARLTLHQLASLPDSAGGPAWIFELPLATPQGAAMAQFVIDHDEDAAVGPGSAQALRARFSLDVEPLGPVHIHLRVAQEDVAVTIWAERDGGVERLRGQGPALAQALSADVVIHPGTPRRTAPPPGPGQFVDQSS